MRAPFEWLREFVNISASAEDAAGRLTMLGLEVEGVEKADGDHVLEINVTPNRSDCLSIIGIARELAAAYGVRLKLPALDVVAEPAELDFNVDIIDTALCRRYAGRIVKNLKIGPSPEWLKKRLEKCGIRSINNVVDVTNYVLLEFGHPLHAFDLKTIRGRRIRIGTPNSVKGRDTSVSLKTLDGVEHKIPNNALLIWDMKRPVAIAGIMGGLETEVSDTTRDIFIESAYFDPVSVRRTSKTLGLKTESSFRFERGTDIRMLKKALDRAAYLMKEVAGGSIYGKIDIYPKRHAISDISVKYDKVNRILGLKLNKKEVLNCLVSFGFKVEEFDGHFKAKPPAFRNDISRDADIIEEVVRAYGYERIPAELPKATIGIETQGDTEKIPYKEFNRALKESFLKSGFDEVINYSFMGQQDVDMLGLDIKDERRNLLQIRNPLRTEDSFMRTTLVPSLIKNVLHNVSHGNRELRLFEMSKVFINRTGDTIQPENSMPEGLDSKLPLEKKYLAAAYYKEKTKSLYKDEASDFFIFKGVLEAILNDLKIRDYSFVKTTEPFLHQGQSADVLSGGGKLGYIGALSPGIIDTLDIKASRMSFMVMEIDIDRMFPYTMQVLKYRPLPRYPFIERDTAMIIDPSIQYSDIIGWLKSYSSELIEDVSVFDVYQGENIPQGKKSIAFNIRYRASDRTLKDDEIDSLHQAVVGYILDKTKGQLRT